MPIGLAQLSGGYDPEAPAAKGSDDAACLPWNLVTVPVTLPSRGMAKHEIAPSRLRMASSDPQPSPHHWPLVAKFRFRPPME